MIRKICVVGVRINMGNKRENRSRQKGHRKGVGTRVLFHREVLWQLDRSRKGEGIALRFGFCVVQREKLFVQGKGRMARAMLRWSCMRIPVGRHV